MLVCVRGARERALALVSRCLASAQRLSILKYHYLSLLGWVTCTHAGRNSAGRHSRARARAYNQLGAA